MAEPADTFFKTIREKRKEDPLIGAKVGSQEVAHRLIEALKNERGVHVESLLSLLGSLAGHACITSVFDAYKKDPQLQASNPLTQVEGADGRTYFFGDAINKPLVEDRYSIWAFAAVPAHDAGKPLPDIEEIFKHVAATVGGEQFGIPRIPAGHAPGDLPIDYVKGVWPHIHPVAAMFCEEPHELPILFGMAIQKILTDAKDVIDATLALQIVMESAIPMSKISTPE